MAKEFTFSVVKLVEDFVTLYSDSLDWEMTVPLDFFPDPLKVEIDYFYLISVKPYENQDLIQDDEFGGFIKQNKSTKFKG